MEINFVFETEKNDTFIIDNKIIHNKKSRKNKVKFDRNRYKETTIKWYLFKYISPVEFDSFNSEFFPWPSSNSLANGLTVESILLFLNSNFNFGNYKLKKLDKLKIYMDYKHPIIKKKSRPPIDDFISLIFEEKWMINEGFDHIDNNYKELMKGEIIIT